LRTPVRRIVRHCALQEVAAQAAAFFVLGWLTHQFSALALKALEAGTFLPFIALGAAFPLVALGCTFTAARSVKRTRNLQRANEGLIRAKILAEESSRAKSESIAVVSHEIRTPIHGIIGALELAAGARTGRDREEYLETALIAAGSLSHLVGDLMDCTRIESGNLSLKHSEFRIRSCVANAMRTLESGAKRKNLELRWSIDRAVPEVVIGDPDRLRQVLLNLVGNAVKFTDQGRVSLEVQCGPMEGEHMMARFVVQDTGIGIAAEDLGSIFEPSVQRASPERCREGNGLGLAIASQFVHLMGGEIHVQSELHRGSSFDFTVRLGCSSRERCRIPWHILFAEDDPLSELVVVEILKKEGHSVTVARSGRQVLDILETQRFDLILMDVRMRDMDGIQTSASIRDREHEASSRIPIVGLSAHADLETRTLCLSSGMDAFVTKPFRKDEILAIIEQFCGPDSNLGSVGTQIPEESFDRNQILVQVGDDPILLQKMIHSFRQQNSTILARIRDSLSLANHEALQHEIHRLKGALSYWGPGKAYRLAQAIETGTSHRDFAEVTADCHALEAAVRQLENELASLQGTVR